MMLRLIISIMVALVTFFALEEEQPDCEFRPVVSGQSLQEVLIEDAAVLAAGCESLPHLEGMRHFHRSYSNRMWSGGNSPAKVNIPSGICPYGRYLMNNIHLSGALGTGKVDAYIFWRNLRI